MPFNTVHFMLMAWRSQHAE